MNQHEIRQSITDKILIALAKGGIPPWRKTWSGGDNSGFPSNIVSRRRYSGINTMILALHRQVYGFQSKWYGTFDQWRKLGCSIKKRPADVRPGEWGAGIIFYNVCTKTVENRYTREREEKTVPFLRHFTVFSIDQVEGKGIDKYRAGNEIVPEGDFIDYDPAEKLIGNLDVKIHYGGDRACYRPSSDEIFLPHKQSFEKESEFYATAFHELLHWSEKRLNWNENYAFSELRAEIGASFLLAELGVPQSENMTNHHAYLESWLQHLQRDNRYIFRASAAASKAVDFILNKSNASIKQEELVGCKT